MSAILLIRPEHPFSDVVAEHGGVAGPEGSPPMLVFAQAAKALACALALKARMAEHHRAKPRAALPLRMALHVAAGNEGIPAQDVKAASLVIEAAPAGRVFLTRQAYARVKDASLCAFIPLGLEYFTGLPDPLEIYEAVRVHAPAPTRPPALVQKSRGEPPKLLGGNPLALSAAAMGALLLFAAKRQLGLVLFPFDVVNQVFHMGGAVIFGLLPSEALASVGGPLTQLLMPLAAAAHSLTSGRPRWARASLFWLGQSVFSLGGPLAMGLSAPSAYGEAVRNAMFVIVEGLGLSAHAFGFGQLLVALGCLLMSFAAVSLAGGKFSGADDK